MCGVCHEPWHTPHMCFFRLGGQNFDRYTSTLCLGWRRGAYGPSHGHRYRHVLGPAFIYHNANRDFRSVSAQLRDFSIKVDERALLACGDAFECAGEERAERHSRDLQHGLAIRRGQRKHDYLSTASR